MSANEQNAKFSRQGRILGGYLLACLTSGVALAIAFMVFNELTRVHPNWQVGMTFGDVIALTIFIVPVILTATFLPATLFVWWSERRAERRFTVYALAGIVMAIVGSTIFFRELPNFTVRDFVPQWILYAPAGLIAGGTYWCIAGRRAGAARL